MEQTKLLPVFYDRNKRRWKIFLLVFLLATSVVGLSLGGLVLSILNDNTIFTDNLSNSENTVGAVNSSDNVEADQNILVNVPMSQPSTLTFLDLKEKIKNVSFIDGIITASATPVTENRKTQIMAYYVNWDENSLASLKENIDNIDTLMPDRKHRVG